jgi:hypothetical protein
LERYLLKVSSAGERDVVRTFLLEKQLVSSEVRLFPDGVLDATADGPLGTTFAAVRQATELRPRSHLRLTVLSIIAVGLLLAVYFGPSALRPDWKTLVEFLIAQIQTLLRSIAWT